ncbi:MAG: hypothetical protein WAM14_20450 [Candidatus Nitrosopolaris sp.]
MNRTLIIWTSTPKEYVRKWARMHPEECKEKKIWYLRSRIKENIKAGRETRIIDI